MHDVNEPVLHSEGLPCSEEPLDHLLGTAVGDAVVYFGLALTVGAVAGIYTSYWLLLMLAVLGTGLWTLSGFLAHFGRHGPPDVRPAAHAAQSVGRAA
ncbi:MAG: hypothetical protein WAW17_17975 [Rhodococcus sp. (in: high G+C Gram-positive bacteria)]|uniref:hypothetical protein n=1 Tax=Rhodococcus sp. TaxID=1831 RepID=UPI003BAFF41A